MFSSRTISYKQTGYFSKIVLDYLEGNEKIRSFYSFAPSNEGIREAIEKKRGHLVDRQLLVTVLREQYSSIHNKEWVSDNIEKLGSPSTFTICTAHQPNLFTGPLYFLYKILHAVKLAAYCKEQFPEFDFVPVYYMGSEDADLEELNHFIVKGKRYEWKTTQTGSVGRMKVDKDILSLIIELEKQIGVDQFGIETISILKNIFTEGKTIMQATLELVHELFGIYGLVIVQPDHTKLKSTMCTVFEEDLFQNQPSKLVQASCEKLASHYNVQAQPRNINLFYLKDNIRERFDLNNGKYVVNNTTLRFSEDDLRKLLKDQPEIFSPNVILRGLYQETILPNIAFVGGGGEIAYWLQLKEMFDHYQVPFPVLILRNSFLIAEKKWIKKTGQVNFSPEDFFKSEKELIDHLVTRISNNEISLNGSLKKTEDLYKEITEKAGAIDNTLTLHVAALQKRSMQDLKELEKKMLRSEKRKYADRLNQLRSVKNALFPDNNLQERIENFTGFYAKWGREMIEVLLRNSPALQQEFTIIEELDHQTD